MHQIGKSVVVVGAGIAGLAAAVHLAERGLKPIILEANQSWLGGRLSEGEPVTFVYDGQHWSFATEHGVHGMWGGYVNMQSMLARFVEDHTLLPVPSHGERWINRWGQQIRHVEAGAAIRGSFLPAPLHYLNLLFFPRFWTTITPLDFLSLPGFLFSLLWTVGYDPIAEESALPGFTMDDFFRLWTPNLKTTIQGVARNMMAAPDEEITLTGLIVALRFYTMLRRDDWKPRFFPQNAGVAVIDPLEAAIVSRGGRVYRGITAKVLRQQGDQWEVKATAADGKYRKFIADYVVLALPPSAAQKLLTDSDTTSGIAASLSFPPSLRNAVVRLWFMKQPHDATTSGMFTGDFVPDNFFWLHELYAEYKDWSNNGGSAIELHFYGDDTLLNHADRRLLVIAIDEVMLAFPELKGSYIHGDVRRNSKTHTAFRVPTQDSLHVETPFENVYACGDWVGYDTPALWMERAVTTGIAAANHVLIAESHEPFDIHKPQPPEPLARGLGMFVGGIRRLFAPLVMAARRTRHSAFKGDI